MMFDLIYENEFVMKIKVFDDDDLIYENDLIVKIIDVENLFFDELKMIVVRNIGIGILNIVVCLNDELIWIIGQSSIIKFYNL